MLFFSCVIILFCTDAYIRCFDYVNCAASRALRAPYTHPQVFPLAFLTAPIREYWLMHLRQWL